MNNFKVVLHPFHKPIFDTEVPQLEYMQMNLDGSWENVAYNPWGNDEDWHPPTETPCWTPSKPDRCTCDSRELFANGCTCGFIVKKSWDEKLFEIDKKKRENT